MPITLARMTNLIRCAQTAFDAFDTQAETLRAALEQYDQGVLPGDLADFVRAALVPRPLPDALIAESVRCLGRQGAAEKATRRMRAHRQGKGAPARAPRGGADAAPEGNEPVYVPPVAALARAKAILEGPQYTKPQIDDTADTKAWAAIDPDNMFAAPAAPPAEGEK